MGRKWHRLAGLVAVAFLYALALLPQSARALDTANVLMNIDGMVISHQGIFRNATPADGAQTFQYGTFNTAAGSQGRYKSFYLVIPGGSADLDGCCISHRIRLESWGPQNFLDEGLTPDYSDDTYGTIPGINITKDYFPAIDRAGFGSVIDPSEYQIEVKFKPLIGVAGIPNNAAKEFNASIDRHYGYVWNDQKDMYERSMEQINYSIGVNSDADYNNDGFVNAADKQLVLDHKGETFQLMNENPFAATPGVVDYEDLAYWEQFDGRVVKPINDWYATAPKDANGFATWKVPLTENTNSGRTTNINYGDAVFREANTVTGGGRFNNPENFTYPPPGPGIENPSAWEDVPVAFGGPLFGGGPSEPGHPETKLNTPNGINLLYFGKNGRHPDAVSLEVQSVAITKINPGQIAARIDEYSGLSARFGSGFTRGPDFAPINVPGDAIRPPATDQISRFDQNGLTNLIFNMRQPDVIPVTNPITPPETHRFLLRYGPGANTFDGTTATVNVRAKLLAGNTATTLRLVAKDLDGNDMAPNQGADEYTYNLDLNQSFNSSTFTTISIPLSAFTLSDHVAIDVNAPSFGSGPGGFVNAGDGLRTDFNLYEFAGLLAPSTQQLDPMAPGYNPNNYGLLKLELDYMEIRLPSQGLIGDYNNSGKVDAADYTIWRNNLGQPGSTLLNRDPNNGVGVVAQADFASWKTHFGEGLGSGALSTANVPEPATISLLVLSLAAVAVGRRTRERV